VHPDHAGGLLDATGNSRFPNAEIFVTKIEKEFWLSNPKLDKIENTEETKNFLRTFGPKILTSLEKQIKTIEDGHKFVEGVEAVVMPGHTPGHAGLRISSGTNSSFTSRI
jgi:glyoxylase-like metal-dependent hydrolase (beta-lactamase superfamily II)